MYLLKIYKIKCILDELIFYINELFYKSVVTEGCAMSGMSNTYSCDKFVCLIHLSNFYSKVPSLFQLINNTQHYLMQHTNENRHLQLKIVLVGS